MVDSTALAVILKIDVGGQYCYSKHIKTVKKIGMTAWAVEDFIKSSSTDKKKKAKEKFNSSNQKVI